METIEIKKQNNKKIALITLTQTLIVLSLPMSYKVSNELHLPIKSAVLGIIIVLIGLTILSKLKQKYI